VKSLVDKSQRLWKLPQQSIGTLKFIRKRLAARGVDLIDLASFIPESHFDVGIFREKKPDISRTGASDSAINEFKKAIIESYKPLSGTSLDPETEIVITPGTRMTASLLALATLNQGDSAAYPDPGMPYFRTAICLADATPTAYELAERNDYIPNIAALTEKPGKKPKVFFFNYPHNPTTSSIDTYFYRDLIKSINFENTLVVVDAAYVHPGDPNAVSILQNRGGKKKAVELYSLSAGLGIDGLGFAAGHRDVILAISELLGSLGFIPDTYRLNVAREALRKSSEIHESREIALDARREAAGKQLKELGWKIRSGRGVPFLWVKPSAKSSSLAFARRLVSKAGVLLSPGSDYGEAGEGWQRLTLHPDQKILNEALDRIAHHSRIWQRSYRPK